MTQRIWTNNIWLDIWGVWDTGWYMDISQNGYTPRPLEELISHQTNVVFFPFYPILMRFLGSTIGDQYTAGFIISNVSLIVACVFLYKLVRLDSDESSAFRSVKYLLLFPVSFILSGVFTESLYLALALMCFYYARTDKWHLAGIAGFFLSLTRSVGVLIFLPLIFEGLIPLLKEKRNLKSFKEARDRILPLFYLLLIPLGIISFIIFNFYLTGDFLAFVHGQAAWGRYHMNPLETIINGYDGNMFTRFEAIFATISIFIFLLFYRKIRFSYWLFGIYSLFIPLSTGIQSMPRFVLVIFPIYILFSSMTKDRINDDLVTIFFALMQGCLMVFWTNSFDLVV
ncbi:hypothetical protein RSJ42_06090 [Methanosarcina hadiensis]|uniref:hypothetical protein n=1 Tax=Methanosarcina hadiensis TaxID=3078083 RepID=UPI003977E24D